MQEIKKINLSLEWKSCKIGDVVSVRRGSSPRPIKDYVSETGMPWVKIADATKDQTRFINFTSEFIKEEGIEKSVVVNPGDLIVSNSATPGLPKFMNIKACVHDGWLVFDSYNGILKDFLYYYFIVIRGRLVNQANGSVFKNLKTDIVRNFDINLPDLETQEKIVKILSQIDKKIETTIKINKNIYIALILTFILTGLGSIYAGNTKKGLALLIFRVLFAALAFFSNIFGILSVLVWVYGFYEVYNDVQIANRNSSPNLINDFKNWNQQNKIIAILIICAILILTLNSLISFSSTDSYSPGDSATSNHVSYSYDSYPSHYGGVDTSPDTIAKNDPDSYYDYYEYGDNPDVDDYLESEGYD